MLLENISGAQKVHIEKLITQYVSTSFALPGRDIDELGDYYLTHYESEAEEEAYDTMSRKWTLQTEIF